MNLKQAKEYFEDGMITHFEAVPDPLTDGGWMLVLCGKNDRSWDFHTALGEVRIFSKVDTLVGQVESIAGPVSSMRISV